MINKVEKMFPDGRITRMCAWFLVIIFLGIVAIERVPGVMVPTTVTGESLMFGQFLISFLDDVTHGLSGLFGLVALLYKKEWVVKWMLIIFGYYLLDSGFHTIYSLLVGDSFMHWFPINAPHYGITLVCLIGLYFGVKKIELK